MKHTKKILISLIITLVLLSICVLAASAEYAVPDRSAWGEKRTITAPDGNTYTYYVDENGTFSTEIGDDDIVWVYAEFIDNHDANGNPKRVSGWFGISNPMNGKDSRSFSAGSRFCVTLGGNKDELMSFEVLDANGKPYDNSNGLYELYIQMSSAVNEETLTGLYVGSGRDEHIGHITVMLPMANIPCPESGKYAVFLLNRPNVTFFSDRAFSSTGSTISTPATFSVALISFAAGAAVSAAAALVICRKKKKSEAAK